MTSSEKTEHLMGAILLIVMVCLIILVPLYLFLKRKGVFPAYSGPRPKAKNDADLESFLYKHVPYFSQIDADEQLRFVARIHVLWKKKQIEARGITLTKEMRILAAASIVQLTFGLDDFIFEDYARIVIFPDGNFSPTDSSLRGCILLRWDLLRDSFEKDQENHYGLHEIAFALLRNGFKKGLKDPFFPVYYDKWLLIAQPYLAELKVGKKMCLPKTAEKNSDHFFAACVVCFFQTPEIFNQEMPTLYTYTKLLLNQNTLGKPNRLDARENFSEHQETDEEPLYAVKENLLLTLLLLAPLVVLSFLVAKGFISHMDKLVFVLIPVTIVTVIPLLKKTYWLAFGKSGVTINSRIPFLGKARLIPWEQIIQLECIKVNTKMGGKSLAQSLRLGNVDVFYEITVRWVSKDRPIDLVEPFVVIDEEEIGIFLNLFLQNQVKVKIIGFEPPALKTL
ncbi:MAG: zinc-dependent peptidase [Bacteroidia bacterium]